MFIRLRASAVGAFALLAGAIVSSPASAICTVANFTLSSACQIGSTSNDFLNPTLKVNQDSMFGFTDWEYAEKWDFGSGAQDLSANDPHIVATGTPTGGTWAFLNANTWNLYDRVMVVEKGPNAYNYVAYLLVNGALTGAYATPFFNQNNRPQGISHLSVYTHDMASAVPEASTWAMMVIGFAGLGFATYRRRRSVTVAA